MLPEEIKKAAEDIKDPITRILVILLISGIILVSIALSKYAVDDKVDRKAERKLCEDERGRLRREIDSMKLKNILDERDETIRERQEKQRLIVWQDSVKNVLQNITKTKR